MKKLAILFLLFSVQAWATYSPNTIVTDPGGVNQAAVKAASTAPVATDPALVVTLSPNSAANSTPMNQNVSQFGGSNVVTGTGASGSGIPRVTVSSDSAITQGTPAALSGKWPVQVTDGTNSMPTMDAVARAGFHKITDGTNTAAVKGSGGTAGSTDPALVVSISPNSPLPAGNAHLGTVTSLGVAPVNVNASNANSTVTTTPATLSAPANAVGFQLQNLQTSTANIRWQLGGASSSSSGAQLAPGQDSGFIPAGSNVSIAAESGTQNYSIQWVSQ